MLEEYYRKLVLEALESEAFVERYRWEYRHNGFEAWKNYSSDAPEQGCATVLDFSNGDKANTIQLDSSTELRQYFLSSCKSDNSSTAGSSQPTRRLFVLEGLDPRFVDVLGSQLRIPPAFFIAQAENPGMVNVTATDSYLHDPAQYWNIQLKQLHKLSDGFYKNRGGFWNGSAPRRLAVAFSNQENSWSFTSHLASFWSIRHNGGSWDAVALVDAAWEATDYEKLHNGRQEPIAGNPEFVVNHDEKSLPKAPHISMAALPPDPNEWATAVSSHLKGAPLASMRLRLLDLYTHFPHGATEDPDSASTFLRSVVFSMWELTTRMLEWRYVALWDDEDLRSYRQTMQWRRADFQKMVDQKLVSRRVKKDFLDACRKLGVVTTTAAAAAAAESRQARSWAWLLERLTILDEQIGDMIMVYGQRSSVEESLTANMQARSVGRLTALATVLVPFTLAAGIFSMSGDFAAGGSRFWVFWAVAIPLASVFSIWVLVKRSPTQLLTQLLKCLLSKLRRSFHAVCRRVSELKDGNVEQMELSI